jgi:hypothetical protein
MIARSARYRSRLRKLLDEHFDEAEIAALCATLRIAYEKLPGKNKFARIRQLILLLARYYRLQALLDLAAEARPDVAWPAMPYDFELPPSLAYPRTGDAQSILFEMGGWAMSAPPPIEFALDNATMGDDVGRDHISVGDISGSQGIAIGAGAMVHNETHHHYYDQSDKDESPKIEEAIRLDAAAPAELFAKQPFDIAVAVRQPDSPQLAVEDLPVVVSESGSVFRSEAAEMIQYRIAVSGKDFVVKPESYTLNLRPRVDSRVCFFQVTPLKSGKKSLLINAYQENDVVAAHTRIQLAVAVKISSETQFLRFLVGQLEVFLHAAPPERASVVKELKGGVNLLIQMAADSPDPALLKMMGDSLAGWAQKLEADSPGIMESLERVVTAVVAMTNSQT